VTRLPFFTIGHSTRSIEAFAALLKAGGVTVVADIRTVPRSRSNPQFNFDVLGENLAPYGIAYERIEALGGLRKRSTEVPPGLNGWWDNQSFHNYADYALSEAFDAGLETLIAVGRAQRTAMMCAEAVWWRCHRRIVADYLIARGETVFHLMGDDRIEPARLTPAARAHGDGLAYPAEPTAPAP
jgi:uncharacterized protein (DUF488 family)